MGMSLVGASRNEHFSLAEWNWLLELAVRQGWRPAGTRLEWDVEDEVLQMYVKKWDGSYCSSHGQTVLAEDAGALADALDRALAAPGEEGVPPQLRGHVEALVRLGREGEFEIC